MQYVNHRPQVTLTSSGGEGPATTLCKSQSMRQVIASLPRCFRHVTNDVVLFAASELLVNGDRQPEHCFVFAH
jgi:hypothetical protein